MTSCTNWNDILNSLASLGLYATSMLSEKPIIVTEYSSFTCPIPSPCPTNIFQVPVSQKTSILATEVSNIKQPSESTTEVPTVKKPPNVKETVTYFIGTVIIALLLGTNLSLCGVLWFKQNQLRKLLSGDFLYILQY